MKKTKLLKFISVGLICVIIAGLFFFPEELLAQGLPGLPDDPEQTPIDGGLGILAAIGGAYAIKKLRDKKEV